MGVSVFTEFLIDELQISRTQLSLSYMLGTFSSALLLPYAGKVLDKVGAQIMGPIAALLLGGCLFLLGFSLPISQYISEVFSLSFTYSALFTTYLIFLGVRHFGQGQMTMISRTMMGRWFEKKRGLILGISGAFVALSFSIAPTVINFLIEMHSWKGALEVIALFLVAMAIMFAVFF